MRSAALFALLALGACNFAPDHTRPELPTASDYPSEVAGDVMLGARATTIGWRDFFADPRLEALVTAALARNRDLVIAVARIEEARGLYRIQNADRYPTGEITGSVTRSRFGEGGGFIGDPGTPGEPGVPDDPGEPDGEGESGPETFNRYSIGVGVTAFELDFWGRVRNLSEAARSEYLATIEAARAFRLALIRDVASAYLAVRETDERIALAEATVGSRREGLRIAQLRLDAGVTSELDYRQAETLLTQAETALAALRRTRAQGVNLLSDLVGGPLPDALPAPLALAEQSSPVQLAAGLPSELLVARPDILAAEERLRAARANVGAARAAFFPNITLTGNVGFSSSELDNLFGGDGFTWSFGPSLIWPILNFGRAEGNLSVSEARENIAVATYERTVQTAFREVADALAGRRYLAEQVEVQERAVLAQRRLAYLARLRYREGVANYLEVLDGERNLFDAEQILLQLRRAEVENIVSLYVALGGGGFDGSSPPESAPVPEG